MKKEYFKKRAFSLAEGMVMLVVVSILMALSAPLIAKRTSADAQRLVRPNNSSFDTYRYDKDSAVNTNPSTSGFLGIFTAIGLNNHQNFGIGTNTPNAKLHVQGTTGNVDLLNVTRRNITTSNNDAVNDTGLFVNNAGETNIVACVPDWAKKEAKPWTYVYDLNYNITDEEQEMTEDGYFALMSRCVKVYKSSEANYIWVCPPTHVTRVNCTVNGNNCTAMLDDLAAANVNNPPIHNVFTGAYMIFPVEKGTKIKSTTTNLGLSLQSSRVHHGLSGDGAQGKDYFIPCKKGYKGYKRGE